MKAEELEAQNEKVKQKLIEFEIPKLKLHKISAEDTSCASQDRLESEEVAQKVQDRYLPVNRMPEKPFASEALRAPHWLHVIQPVHIQKTTL